MQKLIWRNSLNEEINLTSFPFGITEWEGFSNASLNIQSQKVPFQDGGVFLDALMEERELNITLAMNDSNNLETRYELRRRLISILNPKLGEGTLIYTNDYTSKQIKAIPQIPLFENHNSNDSGTPKASLSWTCPSPYWEDVEETVVNLKYGQPIEIVNNGDVPCNIKSTFFTNNVRNPELKNLTSKKLIKLTGTLQNFVNIDTNAGKKSINEEQLAFKIKSNGLHPKDIAYNSKSDIYVVCCGSYLLVSTSDGDWEIVTPAGNGINSVCYSEYLNLFVAVGNDGYILSSDDGFTWTVRNSSADSDRTLYKVKYINIDYMTLHYHYFVAVGLDSAFSLDGINWTISNNVFSCWMYDFDCAINSSIIVAVGRNSNTEGGITRGWLHNNSVTWQTTSIISDNLGLSSVCYSEDLNLFVAVGNAGLIKVSNSVATTWATYHPDPMLNKLISSIKYIQEHKLFIATVSNGRLFWSYDSTGWFYYSFDEISSLEGIDYIKPLGKTILLGDSLYHSDTLDEQNPIDSNWEYFIPNLSNTLYDICFEQGKYILGCDECIKYTTDLINFNTVDYPGHIFRKIIFCKNLNLFVALTNDNEYGVSSNGIDWDFYSDVIDISNSSQLICNDNIVAIRTDNKCYVSNDAITWFDSFITEESSYEIISFTIDEREQFVAVGKYVDYDISVMFYSSASSTTIIGAWQKSSFEYHLVCTDVCYSEEKKLYVATTTLDTFFLSKDRINWYKPGIVWGSSNRNSQIIYNNIFGLFISWNGSRLYVSADGYNWNQIDLYSTAISFNSIRSIEDKIIIVGIDSNLLISELKEIGNIISMLDSSSDVDITLSIGGNKIMITSTDNEFSARLTYRQKYIGV